MIRQEDEQRLRDDPEDVDAYLLAGGIHMATADYEHALADLRAAKANYRGDFAGHDMV